MPLLLANVVSKNGEKISYGEDYRPAKFSSSRNVEPLSSLAPRRTHLPHKHKEAGINPLLVKATLRPEEAGCQTGNGMQPVEEDNIA